MGEEECGAAEDGMMRPALRSQSHFFSSFSYDDAFILYCVYFMVCVYGYLLW